MDPILAWVPWILILAAYLVFFAWLAYLTILARRLVGAVERIAAGSR